VTPAPTPASRFGLVRALFEDLVELPAADRPRALAERCSDPALRGEVERLLLADSDAEVLVSPQRLAAGLASDPLGADAAGTHIGEFTILRLLGTGGMGAVYVAEQAQPRRLVALKVLRPELCTGKTLRRFQVEAEILGRLQHPGIAEIFAAGVHRADAGPFRWDLPFYAMELLEGALPLTVHARERALPLSARLDLVARVCAAVHHAHLRGVIHRDLKPGNVLVTTLGEPKVIDFGVARATDHEPCLTAPGVLVGTLDYMAPEQIEGHDVDVRSDVWALGVMLYELVCGRRPFVPEDRTAASRATMLATPPPAPRSIGAAVSAELEWIVLKALALEPERRYQTAADLADDLGRLSRHESILAAPPSRTYRLRKAIRRHRTFAIATAVAFISLGLGLLGTGVALRRAWRAEADAAHAATDALTAAAAARQAEGEARRAAERAAAEKANADRARADAEAIAAHALAGKQNTSGLLELIQGAVLAASRRGGGRDVTLSQLWEQVAARVDGDASLPEMTRAAALNYLGAIRFHSGDYAAAETLLRRSLTSLEGADGLGSREEILGRASLSEALRLQGKLRESEAELDAALALAERTLAADDAETLSLRRRQVFALLNRGQSAEAVTAARAILEARQRAPNSRPEASAEARADLATALLMAGQVTEAEGEARAALADCARTFGAASEKTANVANTLAGALLRLERAHDAETTAREWLATASATLGEVHPLARALRRTLATAQRESGALAEATDTFRACLAAVETTTNAAPREVLGIVAGLADTLLQAGDAQAALDVCSGHDHRVPQDASVPVLVELAAVQRARVHALLALGRRPEAMAAAVEAEAGAARTLGAEHATTRALRALCDEASGAPGR